MNIILTASNFIFPLITYSYVARMLGADGTGKVALVNSILSYFSYIAVLGIPAYGLRECAKVRDDKEALSQIVIELLIINLISTLVAYLLLAVAIVLVDELNMRRQLFLVMCPQILLKAIGLEWVYQALEEYRYITIRSLIFKIISVVLIFLLIRSEDDYIWYGFLSVFTTSASYLCNFIHIHKIISIKSNFHLRFKQHLKPIFTMFAASIIITIYANFDVTMIGFISSDREVGLYNAALKIKGIVLSVSTAVTSVLIPRITYYLGQKDSARTQKTVTESLRTSMILALPIAIFIFIFSENILRFVCGNKYTNAVSTLQVLMLCIIPLILTNLFGNQLLIPMGLEKRYSQSVFVGMWINLLLNFILIPKFGSYGAAIGTLVTEWWNVFWMSGGVKDFRLMLMKNIKWWKYIFSLALGAVFSRLLNIKLGQVHVFFQLVFCAIVFFGVYYALLLVLKEPLIMRQASNCIKMLKGRRNTGI